MSECDLNQWVRQQLPDCDVLRIENTAERGVPDMNICHKGREAWLECKLFVRDKVLLRPAQFAWGMRRSSHGGRVCVLAWDVNEDRLRGWVYPDIEIIPQGKYLMIMSPVKFCGGRKRGHTQFDLKSFLYLDVT